MFLSLFLSPITPRKREKVCAFQITGSINVIDVVSVYVYNDIANKNL